ncbi:MAG: hypothetical protein VX642_01665 [Bdellovibrionota bacterium]|nr:hypothetical protein [Bdellovibrionota bacterium]
MGHNNDDEKTKKYVDFLTDDENQDFDILNRAEVDESAVDFDPAAVSSIELDSSDSEEGEGAVITGPRTFLADELGIARNEPLVKKQEAKEEETETEARVTSSFARSSSGIRVNTDSNIGSKIDYDVSYRGEQDPDFSYSEFVDILQDATATKAKQNLATAKKVSKSEEPTEEINWDEVNHKSKEQKDEGRSEDVQADYATSKVILKETKTKTEIDAPLDLDGSTEDLDSNFTNEEPLTKTSLKMGSENFREEATDKLSKKVLENAIVEQQKEEEIKASEVSEDKDAVEKPNTSSISQTSVDYEAEGFSSENKEPKVKEKVLHELGDEFELIHRAMQSSNSQNQPNLQSNESLRLAQDKILDLESELEKVRIENQELAAAGEVLKRKLNEQDNTRIKLDKTKQEIEQQLKEEVEHSQLRIQAKNQEIAELRVKVESLELRLQRDLQRVRSRERELENRLEIVRLENSAVLRSKDEHILELKRKLDQKDLEAEQLSERLKNQIDESKEKQEKIKRTIRTLRLALNMLDEAEDDIKLKKTG